MTVKDAQADIVDLGQIAHVFWEGKHIIALLTLISIAISYMILLLLEPRFETKIDIKIQHPVPLLSNDLTQQIFQYQFLDKENFQKWSAAHEPSFITSFHEIDGIFKVDDFLFQQNASDAPVFFNEEQMVIRSNNYKFIADILSYLNFTDYQVSYDFKESRASMNERLLNQYASSAIVTKEVIEFRFELMAFLEEMNKGGTIFSINRPYEPQQIFPNNSVFLFIAGFFGFVCGALYTIIFRRIKMGDTA